MAENIAVQPRPKQTGGSELFGNFQEFYSLFSDGAVERVAEALDTLNIRPLKEGS
jgi:hypothetical protein